MLEDFLDFAGFVAFVLFAIGFFWLKIKSLEKYDEGLSRKSGLQTLFGDEHKWWH